ncbi:hypothetical protein ACJJI4_01220 [Microbulbifer sp. TRSA002]|uniref:hypothetical protein n=1 Tax=Microbulbifer sp. TRSA002 TaxID=3243382 RepID=UPI0040392DB4
MKHTSKVKGFDGELNQLAENVGDLFYDSLSEFLSDLSEKLENDSKADYGRGRKVLAKELHESSVSLRLASENISRAWDICSPFVDEWMEKKGFSERP